jgi:hypothetical protein
MIFSISLTIAFAFMALYTLAFLSDRILGKMLLLLYSGAVFVLWEPDVSTTIANLIGIGRGVDFGLMLVSVISLNLIIFLIHHVHQIHKQITLLTRSIAISDALQANRSKRLNGDDVDES